MGQSADLGGVLDGSRFDGFGSVNLPFSLLPHQNPAHQARLGKGGGYPMAPRLGAPELLGGSRRVLAGLGQNHDFWGFLVREGLAQFG